MEKRDLRWFTFTLFVGPVLWGSVVLAWAILRLRGVPAPSDFLSTNLALWIGIQTAACWYALLLRELFDQPREQGWLGLIEGLVFSPFALIALFAPLFVSTAWIMSLPPPFQVAAGSAALIVSAKCLQDMRASARARLCGRIGLTHVTILLPGRSGS